MGYGIGMHAPGRRADVRRAARGPPPAAGPRPRGDRAALLRHRRGPDQRGVRQPPRARWCPASRHAADVGATKLFDAAVERHLPRADAAGPLPRRPRAAARAGGPRRRHGHHPPAAGLLRAQLLRPDAGRGAADEGAEMPFELVPLDGYETTDSGWPVVPDALRGWLQGMHRRFRAALPPIVVTEYGRAYDDGPGADGDGRRPGPHRLPRRPPARGAPRRSTPASTSAATTPGRCSTASGGPRADPALRPGPRRPRDPGPHPQALLRLVRRDDRRQPRAQPDAADPGLGGVCGSGPVDVLQAVADHDGVGDAGDRRTDHGRHDEQPDLAQRRVGGEPGDPERAGRVDRGVGDRDRDQVDQGQAQRRWPAGRSRPGRRGR